MHFVFNQSLVNKKMYLWGLCGGGGGGANAPVEPPLPTGLDSRSVLQKGQSPCLQFVRVAGLELSPNLLSVFILTLPLSILL